MISINDSKLCSLFKTGISGDFFVGVRSGLSFGFISWLSTEIIIFVDLFFAGFSLKLGGKLAKGPYLPQTLEGLGKTTKAVLGKK